MNLQKKIVYSMCLFTLSPFLTPLETVHAKELNENLLTTKQKETENLNILNQELTEKLETNKKESPDKFNRFAESFSEKKLPFSEKVKRLSKETKTLEPIDNTKNIFYIQMDNVELKTDINLESQTLELLQKNSIVNQIEVYADGWSKVLFGSVIGYIPTAMINTIEVKEESDEIQNQSNIKETDKIEIIEEKESTRIVIPDEVVNLNENVSIEGLQCLGNFKLTFYCPCSRCCGSYASGITATGTTATAGRTIAVDPSIIPYGTEVVINGHTYVAEDCGGGVNRNHIDIFVNSHSEALANGVQYADVYIK